MAGESLHIKGEIVAAEDLRFEGRIEGRISVPNHTLTVGPHATVEADVDARAIIVAGRLVGAAVARERTELQEEGILEGTLDTRTILVREGALLRATVTMPDRRPASVAPHQTTHSRPEVAAVA